MAGKVGAALASVGLVTDVDTVQRNPLGTVVWDESGKAYIYLIGVASTAARSVVTYTTATYQTALSVTGARGPVAIAMAPVLAGQFGWYQIYGHASAEFNGAATALARLFSASTGKCDDAVVSGDQIDGAIVAATVGGAGAGAVSLAFPFMNGTGA